MVDWKKLLAGMKWVNRRHRGDLFCDRYRLLDIPVEIHNMLDVGCCEGVEALVISQLYPNAKIVSIEPTLSSFGIASYNLYDTGVHLEFAGIPMYDGDPLFTKKGRMNKSQNKVLVGSGENDTVDCFSCTLNSIIQKYDMDLEKPSLLKFDCEGCEIYILDKIEIVRQFYQISGEIHYKRNRVGVRVPLALP